MKYKMIPKNKLVKGRWYVGRGRNSNLGYWTGKFFVTICSMGDYWDAKYEDYYTKNGGCFQPFVLVDEGEILPFGKSGWDIHYGPELIIDERTAQRKESPWDEDLKRLGIKRPKKSKRLKADEKQINRILKEDHEIFEK